jgi:hypothetical protein
MWNFPGGVAGRQVAGRQVAGRQESSFCEQKEAKKLFPLSCVNA